MSGECIYHWPNLVDAGSIVTRIVSLNFHYHGSQVTRLYNGPSHTETTHLSPCVQQLKPIPHHHLCGSKRIPPHCRLSLALGDTQPFKNLPGLSGLGSVLRMGSLELQTPLSHKRCHVPSNTFTPHPNRQPP